MAEHCNKKRRDINATDEQKQIILNFMEENIDFGRGKFIESSEGKKKYNALWDVLTQSLNSTEGPIRETARWQRFWSDMKLRVKKKLAEIKKSRGATEGRPQNPKMLSELEERILFFTTPEVTYGPENIPSIRLESDIPIKKLKTESEEETREEAEIFCELAPNTPTTDVESLFSSGSSCSHQTLTPPSSKRKKAITSSDLTMLLHQQTELNMQMSGILSKLDDINSTLESNNNRTNQLLERIAIALEK